MFTCWTLAALFDWSHILFIFLIEKINLPMICVQMSMTSISGRIYTVKEVNTTFYTFENIRWCTYTHKISRFVLW